MKKIRILALVLALLMLPLGILVSCKDNEGPDVDGTEEDDGTTPQKRPTTSITAVDDGTKSGYLCYFTFDPATTGKFQPVAPYTFFSGYNDGNFVFGRRDVGGKKGGYLGIERGATRVDVYYDLAVMSLDGFSYTHVVSFDIYLGGGVMKDSAFFTGRKGGGVFNQFLTFHVDGNTYAGKYLAYTPKKEGEWVNFAVAINDKAREYDVYVNGVKTLVSVPYPTATYSDWDTLKVDRYRIGISGSNANATELRIDNFAVSSGLTPKNATGVSDVTYTDVYTIKEDLFTLKNLEDSKKFVIDTYTANPNLLINVKDDPFESDKLLMSSAMSLAKINFIGEVGVASDLQFDLGVETGKYKYGGNIGGKTFYSDPEIGKSYRFASDIVKEGAALGQLIVTDQDGRTGTYIIEGDEAFTKITIIIDKVVTYATYKDGVFKTVYDDTFNPDDEHAIAYHEGAFHGKDYSYTLGSIDDKENKFVSIKLYPDQINGTVDFSMKVDDTVDINVEKAVFSYDYGIMTFMHEGTLYQFAYNAINDEFTLYDPDESYLLTLPPQEELTLGSGETLAIHYQSFGSGASSIFFPVSSEITNAKPWEKFYFEIYVPENMINFQFGLFLQCTNGTYFTPLKYTKAGLQKVAIPFDEFIINNAPKITEIEKIEFRMTGSYSGSTFGPSGDSNGAIGNDGHDLFICALALVQEKIAEVEGPTKEGVEYCTHQMQDGTSLLEPVAEPVASTCTSIGYYAMRCTDCGATVIDGSQPITEALGHDVSGQVVMTQYPSCVEPGYTYQICKRCGEDVRGANELPILAHDYFELLNNAEGKMNYECKNCGRQYYTMLNSTLISGLERYSLLPAGAKYFYVSEEHNVSYKGGKLNATEAFTVDNVQFNSKYATVTATRVGVDYCVEYYKGETPADVASSANDAYFDVQIGKTFESGARVVFEFDVMLGQTNDSGEYASLYGQTIDRTSGLWVRLFDINRQGQFVLSNGTKEPVQLSPTRFTNIAIVIDPETTSKTLYVDGVFNDTCLYSSDEKAKSTYLDQIRIQYGQNTALQDKGTSMYYNHVYAYAADAPVCLVNTDIVQESKGSLGLYETDQDGALQITELSALEADKSLYLNHLEKSSNYTFGFKFTATAELVDGALLKGGKVDSFNTDVSEELITVKGGYLYYLDMPIHKLVVGEEIDIKLVCEDYLNRVSVMINGKEIVTKIPYGTGNNYENRDSYIRSYTFCAAVGQYDVKEISFVTASQEAAE